MTEEPKIKMMATTLPEMLAALMIVLVEKGIVNEGDMERAVVKIRHHTEQAEAKLLDEFRKAHPELKNLEGTPMEKMMMMADMMRKK